MKQIGNFKFEHSRRDYEHPVYFIYQRFPNPYYGKESEFILAENGVSYYKPEEPNNRINKSVFENKDFYFSIATFSFNKEQDCYLFKFVGDIVPELSERDTLDVFKLIKYGFNVLNNDYTYEADENDIDIDVENK